MIIFGKKYPNDISIIPCNRFYNRSIVNDWNAAILP